MSIIFSGFDRFNQIQCLQQALRLIRKEVSSESQNNESSSPKPEISFKTLSNCESRVGLSLFIISLDDVLEHFQFLFSWNYSIVSNGENSWICGYLDGNLNSIKCFKPPSGDTILQMSCSREHVLCVTDNGDCWSYNVNTSLWTNLILMLRSEVTDEYEVVVSKVSCGEVVNAVLTSTGDVFNFPNKLHLPGVRIKDIDCSKSHILLLSDNGEVFSVGDGSRGQLGHGDLESTEEPHLVEGLAGLVVVAIACGGWHSCAVTADGDLYTWGWNVYGQLGLKASGDMKVQVQAVPVAVDWPDNQDVRIRTVVCGSCHTATLSETGDVWVCGWNGYKQLAVSDRYVDHMIRFPVAEGCTARRVLCGPWITCVFT